MSEIEPFRAEFAAACAEVLASLPDWFGIPESNAEYLARLGEWPSWVAHRGGRVVGCVTLHEVVPGSFEVTFLAVHARERGRGVGRRLMAACEAAARAGGARALIVKTLGPSRASAEYEATRAFYQRGCGFVPLLESTAFWGERNPTLLLAKLLRAPVPPQRWMYHIVIRGTERGEWYAPGSLASEGFVHLSYQPEVAASAHLHFAPGADLRVWQIDPRRLGVVVEEAATPRGLMPHAFGPIRGDAVVAELTLAEAADAPDRLD